MQAKQNLTFIEVKQFFVAFVAFVFIFILSISLKSVYYTIIVFTIHAEYILFD